MKRIIFISLIFPNLLFPQSNKQSTKTPKVPPHILASSTGATTTTPPETEAPTVIPPQTAPYDYKGDTLGMPLSEYIKKYDRALPPGESRQSRAPHILDYENPPTPPKSIFISAEEEKQMAKERERKDAPLRGWIESTPDMRYEWGASRPRPTVAGVNVNDLSYWFFKTAPEPRLAKIRITFPSDSFYTIKIAMTGKWGTPAKIEIQTLQNRMGAKFDGEVVIWNNGISEIQLIQYNIDLKFSLLEYRHLELIKVGQDKAKENLKALSSDL